jgi:hypothetical protein
MVFIMCRLLRYSLLSILLTTLLFHESVTASPNKISAELATLQKQISDETSVQVMVSLVTAHDHLISEEKVAELQANFLTELKRSNIDYKLLHSFRFAVLVYIEIPASQVAKLANEPLVQSLDINHENRLFLDSSVPFTGADQIHNFADGTGRAVAIIDTPVNPFHSDFGDCADLSAAACRVKAVVNFTNDEIADVSPVHGSNVAGITLGLAPGIDLYSLNVFHNVNGGVSAFDFDIFEALDYVLEQKLNQGIPFVAVNMSLGSASTVNPCFNSAYINYFSQLHAIGILPVVATGNDAHQTLIGSPACAPGAVSVGAVMDLPYRLSSSTCNQTGSVGAVACFTNRNGIVDFMASGVAIQAGGYNLSGTSMATPHVAGAVALMDDLYDSALTPINLQALLKMWSLPVEANGHLYSSLNFNLDRFVNFEWGTSASFAFTQIPERTLSNNVQVTRFTVLPAEDFQVGKAYLLLKAAHPTPHTLEVFITSPSGVRSGGVIGDDAIPDGTNINAVIGSDMHYNLFHALSGTNSVGEWQVEVMDPNNLGGHLFSVSLFLATADQVSEPISNCRPCDDSSDCDANADQCVSVPNFPNPQSCMPSCQDDQDCFSGSTCVETQCIPNINRTCLGNEVWLYDTCGNTLGLETSCPQSCVQGECVFQCIAESYTQCSNGDVYWFDSCDQRGDLFDQCTQERPCREVDGQALCQCIPNSTKGCLNGDVYNFDSCGAVGTIDVNCGSNRICEESGNNASCVCTEQASFTCFEGDVYWFDSCGVRETLKQECANNERCSDSACQDLGCEPDQLEDNDDITLATPLTLGEVVEGLNLCDDNLDYYAISLAEGTAVDIELFSENLVPTLSILNSFGNPLAIGQNGSTELSQFTSLTNGLFYVQVKSFDEQSGPNRDYQLLIRAHCEADALEHNDTIDAAQLVDLNANPINLSLCDEDWFSFDANVGDLLGFTLTQSSTTAQVISLHSPNQTHLISQNTNSSDKTVMTHQATVSGRYYVSVRSATNEYTPLNYTLRCQKAETEACDGFDNDLNEAIDDQLSPPFANRQLGLCRDSKQICAGEDGWIEPDYETINGYEVIEVSCDGLDNDCDGNVDEALTPPSSNRAIGICEEAKKICAGASGWIEPDLNIYEGFEPVEASCDGLDNDCDGESDESLIPTLASNQSGVCARSRQICLGQSGWGDPDYTQLNHFEGNEATCDGLDNDCDGQTDEQLTPPLSSRQTGICQGSTQACAGSRGWIDPNFSFIDGYQNTESSCDGLDNDCDGQADEALTPPLNTQQAGVCEGGQQVCEGEQGWRDSDRQIQFGYEATEATCDGLDNDCDERIDESLVPPRAFRQNGVCSGSRQVCNGDQGWQEPLYASISSFEEIELSCDGLDNDCDQRIDEELDAPLTTEQFGVCQGTRMLCFGSIGWINPDFLRVEDYEQNELSCDGLDNDCDGNIDENLTSPLVLQQSGVCAGVLQVCGGENGWVNPTNINHYELIELTCDGLDNDCDGLMDESLTIPLARNQIGVCQGALQVCQGPSGWSEPLYSTIDEHEFPELSCDGLDNDCDGQIDEELIGPSATMTEGVCLGLTQVCLGEMGWSEPAYDSVPNYQVNELACDELDNDCDGNIDETLDCDMNAGEMNAGEMNAGEMNAGEMNAGEMNAGEMNAGEMNAGEMNAGEMNAGDDVVQIAGDSLQVADDTLNQDQPETDMGANMDIEENPPSYGCDLKPNHSHTAMHFLLVLILSAFWRRKRSSTDYS